MIHTFMEGFSFSRVIFYSKPCLKIPFVAFGYGNIVCSPNLKTDTKFMGKIIEHICIERFVKIGTCSYSKNMFGISDLLRIGNCHRTDNCCNCK